MAPHVGWRFRWSPKRSHRVSSASTKVESLTWHQLSVLPFGEQVDKLCSARRVRSVDVVRLVAFLLWCNYTHSCSRSRAAKLELELSLGNGRGVELAGQQPMPHSTNSTVPTISTHQVIVRPGAP